MKVILVVVTSQDGFITDRNGRYTFWTSDEDKKFYELIKSGHKLYVFGSGTYDVRPKKAKPGTLKVILTSRPKEYSKKQVHGQLEFYNLTPKEFVNKYNGSYESCLLLGGSYLYTEFLEQDLVDEIYITIEPIALKSGTPFLRNSKTLEQTAPNLPKPKTKKLNKKGTILKHYILK